MNGWLGDSHDACLRRTALLPALQPLIGSRNLTLREKHVILDADLAELYGVETKRFNEAVKRNLAKFPADFMFTLTAEEFGALRSQFATSNDQAPGRGGRRYAPRFFTEHGALMAATILNSPRAVEVSIFVVRAFVRMRELTAVHADLAKRLMAPPDPPKRPIGFINPKDKGSSKKTSGAKGKT